MNPGSYVSLQSHVVYVGLWVLHTYSLETVLPTAKLSVPPVRTKIMEIHKIYHFNISGLDSYSFMWAFGLINFHLHCGAGNYRNYKDLYKIHPSVAMIVLHLRVCKV